MRAVPARRGDGDVRAQVAAGPEHRGHLARDPAGLGLEDTGSRMSRIGKQVATGAESGLSP